MIELFPDISDQIRKEIAEVWDMARSMSPLDASNFLNTYTTIFEAGHTPEETDFVQFYFNLQMEAMKE